MAKPTATAVATETITVAMSKDKETQGAVRYADSTDGSVMPTLYVRKDAFDGDVYPEAIEVTVTF